jgi:hypothetical protein
VLTAYPSSGTLTRWVKPVTGGLAYVSNKLLVTVNSTAATNWGINLNMTGASNANLAMLNGTKPQALGNFVSDETTGKVYYGSGGVYHYVASYSTYISLGGGNQPLIQVSPDFFTGLTQGATLN